MEQTTEQHALLRDLALIYIALAHGTDQELDEGETEAIAQRLRVREAVEVYMLDDVVGAFEEAVRNVAERLPLEQRQHIMDDMVEIAIADDKFSSEEGSFIGEVARVWEVHVNDLPEEDRRKWSILSQNATVGDWTALHDLALVYVTLAHQADSDLSAEEVEAVSQKLNEWLPDAKEVDVLNIVQEVITAYANGEDKRLFDGAVANLHQTVPEHQRHTLLDDLRYVAAADGEVVEAEERLIARLAHTWGIEKATK